MSRPIRVWRVTKPKMRNRTFWSSWSFVLRVACILALSVSYVHAVIPIQRDETVHARYVLLQQGREAGWEEASWEVNVFGGWTLKSRGELSMGEIAFSFEQETNYGRDMLPVSYSLSAMAGDDAQIIRFQASPDSIYMGSRIQGEWQARATRRTEPFTLLDNFLTSHIQTTLWVALEQEWRIAHSYIPQRLFTVPIRIKREGDFFPDTTLTEDRSQRLPVAIPAQAITLDMPTMAIQLAVAEEEGWVLEAAVPSKGIRFELRELRRDEEIIYESGPLEGPEIPGVREVDIPFENDGLKFTGTLCLPRGDGQERDQEGEGGGPFPTVLLLQGTGPLDRDGTIGPNTPLRDIAHGLAQRGVASFRFDKRTYLHALQIDLQELTLDDELIRDAQAALGLLVDQPEVRSDALFVLGHSVGGTAALLLEPPPSGLRGVVLMATKGRLLPEILRSQIEYLAGLASESGEMTAEEEERTRATLEKLDALEAGMLPKDEIVLGMPVSYIEDIDRRDIGFGAARLGAPILILQGGKDYQVTEEDARILEQWFRDVGISEVTATIFPDLGHIFTPVPGRPSPEIYRMPQRVDDQVVDVIALWVEEHVD